MIDNYQSVNPAKKQAVYYEALMRLTRLALRAIFLRTFRLFRSFFDSFISDISISSCFVFNRLKQIQTASTDIHLKRDIFYHR